jgi:diguanylate cyclase (GGDEF)-like protein
MNKYDIVRVYVFRLLNEDELYINPLNPSSPPYDIKIKLEAVNDERIRHVRYETYEEVYRHDRSDEELRTNYLEQKDFARREIDSFGDFYTAYRPLYNENNEFIGYIGVETSLTSFVSNMNKLKSNVLGIAITLGCILIVILGIMIIIYRVDLSKRILEQSSFRDSTTGLYNRFIRRKLQKVLGKDTSVSYAFILIDIDEMEKINATYGRKNGDVLIKYVASVIKNQLRGSYDIPIYLGEDDFVIIIKDESVNNVTKIAKRIIDDMQQFKMFEAILSVGITLTNIDELTNNFNTAYARADAAIYEARNNKEDYQIAVRLKTEYTGEDVLL